MKISAGEGVNLPTNTAPAEDFQLNISDATSEQTENVKVSTPALQRLKAAAQSSPVTSLPTSVNSQLQPVVSTTAPSLSVAAKFNAQHPVSPSIKAGGGVIARKASSSTDRGSPPKLDANFPDWDRLERMLTSIKSDICGKIDSLAFDLRSKIASVKQDLENTVEPILQQLNNMNRPCTIWSAHALTMAPSCPGSTQR
ncbi:hypothetical protein PAMA_000007 [Pampus argenteus]